MAKNNIAAASREFSDTIGNFSKARKDVILAIDQLAFDEKKEKNREIAIAEQVAASDAGVEERAQRYKSFLGNPSHAVDFIPPTRVDNVLVHFDWVDCYNCFYFKDQIKAARSALIRELCTGDEIPSEVKARLLAEIPKKRAELWKRYEQMTSDLEAAGLHPDRDPRIPPQIFLEFAGDSYNMAKLENLRRKMKSFHGLVDDIQYRRQQLSAKQGALEREREQLVRRPTVQTPDLKHVEKQDLEFQAEAKKLNEEYTALNKESAGVRRLLTNCESFLREQGLGSSKFEIVAVTG
jgi:hypothetical protein